MIEILKSYQKKLQTKPFPAPGSWINIINPTEAELNLLKNLINIPKDIFNYLKDKDELSRTERFRNFLFILIKVPKKKSKKIRKDNELEYSAVPLGIIITRDFIITISFFENEIINYLKKQGVNTAKKIQTTLRILLISTKTFLEYLKEMHRKIYSIQKGLEKATENEKLIELLNIQKSLFYFNTSLKSNQILIDKLTRNKTFTRYYEDRELLEDVTIENTQAIETVNIYSNILTGTMEAFGSIISNNLNIVMRFLTTITIILMIPTLIASIYGMNIPLPFQHSTHAFSLLMLVSLLFTFIGVIIFWRKKLF